MRIGVIGLGWFGELHCDTIQGISNLELYGISTRNQARLNSLQKKFRCPVATTNYEELLLDENVDLVVICTPPKSHAAIAIAALKNNKNVLVEKPISSDLAQAQEIIEASYNSRGKLFIGHICRFNIRYQEAKLIIQSGEIGEVLSITTHRRLPASRTESLLQETSPFVSDAIHDINLILWFTQMASGEIYAQTSTKRNFKNPDLGHIIIKTNSGMLANLQINWHMPDQTPYSVDEYCQVVGTKGCIQIGSQIDSMHIVSERGFRVPDLVYWPKRNSGHVGALREEYLSLIEFFEKSEYSELANIQDAYNSLLLALAAEKSARYSEVIQFSLNRQKQ